MAPKTKRKYTSSRFTRFGIAICWLVLLALIAWKLPATLRAEVDSSSPAAKASGEPGANKQGAKPAVEAADAVSAVRAIAQTLLRRSHATLLSQRSIQADIVETAMLTDPPLKLTGRYLSSGIKLRLEYTATLPGGVTGKLIEVCDGQRLWSHMELPGAAKVTRRDLRQIMAAAERVPEAAAQRTTVDLALGGFPAIISSLLRTMNFESVKEDRYQDQRVWILTGRWNEEFATKFGGHPQRPKYAAHIPDAARITLQYESLWPLRLQYLKRDGREAKALLDLQIQNVVVDEPIDDREFSFTPPEGVEPEDITKQYLQDLSSAPTAESKSPTPAP